MSEPVAPVPGPWAFTGVVEIRGRDDELIAFVRRGHEFTSDPDRAAFIDPECIANAQLIAAAPELLGALQRLAKATDHHLYTSPSFEDVEELKVALRHAVDVGLKAIGEEIDAADGRVDVVRRLKWLQ